MQLTRIEGLIYEVRGRRVMLDRDLALLYSVDTRVLNQAVRRNLKRFPDDFMFRLTAEERDSLRSQIVILESGRGHHRKYPPFAFTEQGVAMLSSVLRSSRAIQVNIEIMRAFVKLRKILVQNKELAEKLAELECKVTSHDQSIRAIFEAIRQLMEEPVSKKRRIGFGAKDEKDD
ncbi:MAG TPA: ORF6N domain-containing protein [Myxococcota bacterium]|nr:ORF6N domain-containing protein [Myxococcota bacterium]